MVGVEDPGWWGSRGRGGWWGQGVVLVQGGGD